MREFGQPYVGWSHNGDTRSHPKNQSALRFVTQNCPKPSWVEFLPVVFSRTLSCEIRDVLRGKFHNASTVRWKHG